MANAPTRPPARPEGGRRPPKGPLVARSTRRLAPAVVRARLTVAADRLAERGDKDLAEAVHAVLDTRGWELLKPPTSTGGGNPNVALFMSKSVKKTLEESAAEAGREAGKKPLTVLAEVVNEGWQKFLDGEFEPVPPARAGRGKAPEKENLNIRPDGSLRKQVTEAALERGTGLTAGQIAMSYLFDEYGISDADQLK